MAYGFYLSQNRNKLLKSLMSVTDYKSEVYHDFITPDPGGSLNSGPA